MGVDPRRDHSIRVPRPDLSVELGVPNACNRCHADQSPQWAADAVAGWYGPKRRLKPHFGRALQAGRTGVPGAREALVQLALDDEQPTIARASALSLLRRYPGPKSLAVAQEALRDDSPIVRVAALDALEPAGPQDRWRLASPLLDDDVRGVRIRAARLLAAVPSRPPAPEALDRAMDEYVASELTNAERPEAHVNLGNFYGERALFAEAEAAYRQALRLDPAHVPAFVNLADLYRIQGRDEEGETLLRRALEISPDLAAVHHALGLLLVRQGRTPEAVDALRRAAELAPENARFGYVYAIALDSVGERGRALWELERAHARHPNDRDILMALVGFHRDAGNLDVAIQYADKLIALSPDDPVLKRLIQELRSQRNR